MTSTLTFSCNTWDISSHYTIWLYIFIGNSDEASNRDQWIIVAYSAAAASFAITSIVFFVVVFCCLCRCYHQKKNSRLNIIKNLRPSVIYKKPDHVYDEIDHDVPPRQELGTKKNEAYYSIVKWLML